MIGGWSVDITEEIAAVIRTLPPEQKRRVRDALRALRDNGEAGKPLTKELVGYRSLPVKPLRIVYAIVGREVRLRIIEQRETVYEILASALRSAEPQHRRRLLQTARSKRPGGHLSYRSKKTSRRRLSQ